MAGLGPKYETSLSRAVVAVLAGAVVAAFVVIGAMLAFDPVSPDFGIEAGVHALLLCFAMALGGLVLVGCPIWAVLHLVGVRQWWAASTLGVVLIWAASICASWLIDAVSDGPDQTVATNGVAIWVAALLVTALGALVGLVIWSVAYRRAPPTPAAVS